MTAAFTLFAFFADGPVTIFIFALIAMLPSAPLNAGIFTYVFAATSLAMQGRIIATFQTVGGLAAVIGPLLAGYAAAAGGSWVLLASCAVSFLGVLILAASADVRSIRTQDL